MSTETPLSLLEQREHTLREKNAELSARLAKLEAEEKHAVALNARIAELESSNKTLEKQIADAERNRDQGYPRLPPKAMNFSFSFASPAPIQPTPPSSAPSLDGPAKRATTSTSRSGLFGSGRNSTSTRPWTEPTVQPFATSGEKLLCVTCEAWIKGKTTIQQTDPATGSVNNVAVQQCKNCIGWGVKPT